ncbi:10885_t:CDS:10 [Diversispora eburnea]|uniref:10885_t:CDS:1 n=1 Tax=Diversispora eburnea TaxID=1213867 RepID=A0A9N9C7D2_9GLOM|nr:10885_t:CDS:10 [Diversispora eburnea]
MFINCLIEGKTPVKALIDTSSKFNTISKRLFDNLEEDYGLEGISGDDLIGEEIKYLDLQFCYKRKWQSLDATEVIDFQICKNLLFDLMLEREWLWMHKAKISFEFSSETCEHRAKIIIDDISILLIDEDFNKASTTKNNLPKHHGNIPPVSPTYKRVSKNKKYPKVDLRDGVWSFEKLHIIEYELSCINKAKLVELKGNKSGPSNSRLHQNKSKKGEVRYSTDSDTDFNSDTYYSSNSGSEALESYLTSTAPGSVSYLGFLKSKRTIIIKTPPLSCDWKGLNGAWYGRFKKASKEFNLPLFAEEDTRAYWEELIDERKKASEKPLLVHMLVFVGEDVGEEFVDEYQSSKRLKYDEQGQRRTQSGRKIADCREEESSDEIDESSQNLSAKDLSDKENDERETLHMQQRKRATRRVAMRSQIITGAMPKSKGNNVIRNGTPPLQISTTVNQNLLDQLDKEKENAKLNIEPICSNIIDATNKNLMTRLQLERDYYVEPIFNATTKYIDELIENSHNRSDLRKKLQAPFLPPEETYSFEKHYEISWALRFADKLLSFFEAPRNPLLDKNSEGWINCHLLTPLIDDCFLMCEEIQILRCEEMSLASISRKNLLREESSKKQPGHKIDIIFRVDDMEYFGAETFVDGDFQNSKPINYKHKLFREMKDQLDRLLKKLKFTKETIKLVKQIVLHGISHGGYNGKVYAMYYDINLRYYLVFEMCQYRIGTTWNSVPESLNILKDILNLKKGIIHTLDIVTRIKKRALQTRSKELFSIGNLPETTRSPQKR